MIGLNKIRQLVEDWCRNHEIPVSFICDTPGIQGIKIFNKDRNTLRQLFEDLMPVLTSNEYHYNVQNVRGGLLLSFSVKALSESEVLEFINSHGEIVEIMTFQDKLDDAFISPIRSRIESKAFDLYAEARRIAEDAFKDATEGGIRSNQSSRQRSTMYGKPGEEKTIGGYTKKPNRRKSTGQHFSDKLMEALEGMATATDAQPMDLFKKFGEALTNLGTAMGIGPLQQQLKSQGINWKKSGDNQSIILYVINAETKAPQPIARISAETLAKPHDFEQQLLQMIDFSKGEAPGAFKQKQEELREQEKVVRDIAKSVVPEPQQAAPPNVGAAAATQAATPKPPANQPMVP